MAYRNFTEKEVRKAILKKAAPTIVNKRAPHWRGKIFIDDVYFSTVKIPNPHKNNFGPSKAKNVANQLGLNQNQYNEFVSCSLSGKEYYKAISSEEE